MKAFYLDMDGTIADLYGVENWEPRLRNHDPTPYSEAKPFPFLPFLISMLSDLKEIGYTIGIITWLSKQSTKDYDTQVRKAKRDWLKEHFPENFFNEIHIVQYGTPKHTVPKIRKGTLMDDDSKIRRQWANYGGMALRPPAY